MSAVTYGTGNTIVDQMGQISITGDVTPRIWRVLGQCRFDW
ncbi:hypothetical protein [Olsenella uli]|nr:hypothetical protein [Olsenella uli]